MKVVGILARLYDVTGRTNKNTDFTTKLFREKIAVAHIKIRNICPDMQTLSNLLNGSIDFGRFSLMKGRKLSSALLAQIFLIQA